MIPKFRAWLKNDKEMIDVMQIAFDTKWIRVRKSRTSGGRP